MNRPGVSVVTSLYKSEEYIMEFYNRISQVVNKLECKYEFVFVLDGKTDSAGDVVKDIIKTDENVRLIELSKNFGHQAAMFAGIENAKMDTVFTIDVDLEEPPECLLEFYNVLIEKWYNVDAVVGIHENRDATSIQRFSGKMFYSFFNLFTEEKITNNQLWARLMKREYVNAYLQFKEYLRFSAGIFEITGFNQVYLPVKKTYKGSSSYSMLGRLGAGVDAITSFSTKPLRLLFIFGLILFLFSTLVGLALIVSKLYVNYFSGWLSSITLIILFGSLNLMAIGIVGIYVAKVFIESKKRPLYLIRKIHGND